VYSLVQIEVNLPIFNSLMEFLHAVIGDFEMSQCERESFVSPVSKQAQ